MQNSRNSTATQVEYREYQDLILPVGVSVFARYEFHYGYEYALPEGYADGYYSFMRTRRIIDSQTQIGDRWLPVPVHGMGSQITDYELLDANGEKQVGTLATG